MKLNLFSQQADTLVILIEVKAQDKKGTRPRRNKVEPYSVAYETIGATIN